MTSSLSISTLKKLYDRDFELWMETTVSQIRERRFHEIDWEHLLEELEDMGKSEKKALTSNIMILIAHLLKLKIQCDAPETMKKSWYDSVDEHRSRVVVDLIKTPSLKSSLEQAIEEAYSQARKIAIKQGKRAALGVRKPEISEYPLDCPFTKEQLLDEDFYL